MRCDKISQSASIFNSTFFWLWSIYCLFCIFARYSELFKAVCICLLCKLNQLVLPQFTAILQVSRFKDKRYMCLGPRKTKLNRVNPVHCCYFQDYTHASKTIFLKIQHTKIWACFGFQQFIMHGSLISQRDSELQLDDYGIRPCKPQASRLSTVTIWQMFSYQSSQLAGLIESKLLTPLQETHDTLYTE